jgi:hypothetical protein
VAGGHSSYGRIQGQRAIFIGGAGSWERERRRFGGRRHRRGIGGAFPTACRRDPSRSRRLGSFFPEKRRISGGKRRDRSRLTAGAPGSAPWMIFLPWGPQVPPRRARPALALLPMALVAGGLVTGGLVLCHRDSAIHHQSISDVSIGCG